MEFPLDKKTNTCTLPQPHYSSVKWLRTSFPWWLISVFLCSWLKAFVLFSKENVQKCYWYISVTMLAYTTQQTNTQHLFRLICPCPRSSHLGKKLTYFYTRSVSRFPKYRLLDFGNQTIANTLVDETTVRTVSCPFQFVWIDKSYPFLDKGTLFLSSTCNSWKKSIILSVSPIA